MNIVMFTNTYLPHVGGVAHSVQRFTEAYRAEGHRVLIIAPEFEEEVPNEQDVIRVKAIQRFNGSDFALALPAPPRVRNEIEAFHPDILHSHHPSCWVIPHCGSPPLSSCRLYSPTTPCTNSTPTMSPSMRSA